MSADDIIFRVVTGTVIGLAALAGFIAFTHLAWTIVGWAFL